MALRIIIDIFIIAAIVLTTIETYHRMEREADEKYRKVTFEVIKYLFKEEEEMAVAYCTLIAAGKKTYNQVPARLKDEVKQMLIDLDLEYLIEE